MSKSRKKANSITYTHKSGTMFHVNVKTQDVINMSTGLPLNKKSRVYQDVIAGATEQVK